MDSMIGGPSASSACCGWGDPCGCREKTILANFFFRGDYDQDDVPGSTFNDQDQDNGMY
jgi:hypothetical protein